MSACPCGSGDPYAECCGPLHDGARAADTVEQLMRSRFSAFARARSDYLLATWDPATRPAELDVDDGTEWRRLHIVDTDRGGPTDDFGVVEFVARWQRGGESGSLRERSEFTRRDGRWFYVSGTLTP